jgi:hypothetical protein
MSRHTRRWLALVATGIAAIVLAVAIPSLAAAGSISDEDDCTMGKAALSERCTR